MLYRVIMLVGLIALLSCSSRKDKEIEALKARVAEANYKLSSYEETAKITFLENSKVLGEINHSDTTEVNYTFINTGKVPLIVEDVRASCGCTVPTWTNSPVAVGDSGRIVLRYIPKPGEAGQNVLKQASLSTNAGPAKVDFKAIVK